MKLCTMIYKSLLNKNRRGAIEINDLTRIYLKKLTSFCVCFAKKAKILFFALYSDEIKFTKMKCHSLYTTISTTVAQRSARKSCIFTFTLS